MHPQPRSSVRKFVSCIDGVVWLYHPPYTLYLSLTATPLSLLAAIAIGLEYNAVHSSVGGRVAIVSCCRQSASECKRIKLSRLAVTVSLL